MGLSPNSTHFHGHAEPEAFHAMARADTQYSQLYTLAWGQAGRIIAYQYDDNGSLTSKTTTDTASSDVTETVVYTYNLHNRLATVTTTPYSGGVAQSPTITEYRYNPQGIRVAKIVDDAIYTDYLIDPYNPTGYAQVMQETTDDGTALTRIQYTIGDDVISQTQSTWNGSAWTANPTQYLLYDGHGSTRQLVGPAQTVQDSYSYDAYGVMLGSAANPADSAQTKYLYAGEQYDSAVQMYYNRARYYNPSNGLFNRVDPYAGNLHDPQSLHKYLYCHANPVNMIDPAGLFSIGQITISSAIMGVLSGIATYAITGDVKTAVVVGVLAALLTAAVLTAITHWPQIMSWIRSMLNYQRYHRTVSDRLYNIVSRRYVGEAERLAFYNKFSACRLWLKEFPVGVGQNLLRAFTNPTMFLHWANPTPAGLIGAGLIASGVVIYLVYVYWDDIEYLWDDINLK